MTGRSWNSLPLHLRPVETDCPVTGKLRHRKRRDAERDISRRKGTTGTVKLRPYRCQHCDGWHITSQAKR